tara:strand:- start:21556 stop:21717 length:162 start_codon:yes stop_codon:yes gene_type:complete
MSYLEKWECDGCGKEFDKTQIVESIQQPYYACHTCENELIKETEKRIKENESI